MAVRLAEDIFIGEGEELASASIGIAAAATGEGSAGFEQAATRGLSNADAIFARESASTAKAAATTEAKAASTEAVTNIHTGRLSGVHPVTAIAAAVPLTAGVVVAGYTSYNVNRVVDHLGSTLAALPGKAGKALENVLEYTHQIFQT